MVRFVFLNIGHALTHLFMLVFTTVVIALEAQMGRSYDELLALSMPCFIAYGAGALPAGWLADRWSRKGMLAIFFLGLGVSAILTGFATSPSEIAIGLAFIGLFGSIYHPVGLAMVVEGRDKVGKVLGINGLWGNLGVAFAALIAGGLTSTLGWHYAYIVPGAFSLVVGLLFIFMVREVPRDKQAKRKVVVDDQGRKVPPIMYLVMITGVIGAALIFNTTTVTMPKVIDEGFPLVQGSVFGIGGIFMVIAAIASFTQLATGYLVDRFPIRPVWIMVVLAEIPLLLLVGQLADIGLLVVVLPLMMMVFGEIPIQDALLARYTNNAWRARMYGLKFVLALGTAAAVVPIVSWLHGKGDSFMVIYSILAGAALIVALAATLMPRQRPDSRIPAVAQAAE
ncbi:MAG: MFS transporter [Alphaproteobacteria bacterium]|nr:MFS transporter [Alphaproteobacteria bacterium]